MSRVTYKSLHQLVVEEIEGRINYSTSLTGGQQLKRTNIAPLSGNSLSDITSSAIVSSIQTLLANVIRPRIINGLYVKATSPISSSVIVETGRGVSYGRFYEIQENITLPIPFDLTTSVFYIVLFDNSVMIETTYDYKKLLLAKIIVPKPGTTSYIVDNKDDESSYDAYIVNQQDYYLYGDKYGKFEEDTVELLRDNISPILADNLIGNIRLTEDLKITNTSGTLELDSREMRLQDTNGNRLMRLNKNGTFFYDTEGREIARFSVDGARVGNIVVTKNSIQSGDFVSGALGTGFQIQDNGDAEFNNIRARGKFTTSVFEKDTISSVGGNLLVADSDILDLDMTALDNSTLTITGDTVFEVGDILRIKDGVDDEWLEVTDVDSASNTYTVTRDKAGDYTFNNNPIWKKGTAVINYGASTDGMIYMTASETNAPYMSVITTGTTPWIAPTTRLRIGNLNGFLGYTEDAYGTAIGDEDNYLKYDPVNGLRIKGNITITGGSTIPYTFYQDNEPGSGDNVKEGDYWIDTNDNNKLYIYQGNTWVVISQSAGGSGISSFHQSATASGEGIPTSLAEGDLWYNTDNNRLYRAVSEGANEIAEGEWEITLSSLGSSPSISEGLYLSADYMGYYNGNDWLAYISANGNFYFGSCCDSGNDPQHICWDGTNFCVRGHLLADDIQAGCLCLSRGVTIQSNPYESGESGYTVFDTLGIRSYNTTGDLRFCVTDGHIEAQDIILRDPLCCDCYSFLYAGALKFHDEYGDIPYVKRICSGQANTGDTVYLPGWKCEPKLQVGINTLYSYNASNASQNQQWAVYYDGVCCYCHSGTDYGYQFKVHSELRLASGTGNECLKEVAWGTSVCTQACVCSTKVKSKFCMWCNGAAPSNYYAGVLCYRICYKVAGAGSYCCYGDYCKEQPHASESELKAISEQTQTLNFPCMATWEILACCLSLAWHDTGINASTTVCCICERAISSGVCCIQSVNCMDSSCNCCCCCISQRTAQISASIAGSYPSNVYCTYVCVCWQSVASCHLKDFLCTCCTGYFYAICQCTYAVACLRTSNCGIAGYVHTEEFYKPNGVTCCSRTCTNIFNFGPTGYCKSLTNQDYSNIIACLCTNAYWCSDTCSWAQWNCQLAVAHICINGGTLYHCYCTSVGGAASCCFFCNHSLCDTFGCYCILDANGTVNWLAIAYG